MEPRKQNNSWLDLRIPQDISEWLYEQAQLSNITVSELVRLILEKERRNTLTPDQMKLKIMEISNKILEMREIQTQKDKMINQLQNELAELQHVHSEQLKDEEQTEVKKREQNIKSKILQMVYYGNSWLKRKSNPTVIKHLRQYDSELKKLGVDWQVELQKNGIQPSIIEEMATVCMMSAEVSNVNEKNPTKEEYKIRGY